MGNEHHTDPRMDDDVTDDFDEVTQPLRLALSLENAGQTRCNGLFERLAVALGATDQALERLLAELLVYVDATPATLTAPTLWSMRTGLFEIVDSVLPAASREEARSRLALLLLEVGPLDREGSD